MLWTVLEIIGTVAFAAAGAIVGVKKRLDIFGVAILAVTTAVGGGIIRDTLLGNTPPLAFQNPVFLLVSLGTAAGVCLFIKQAIRWQALLNVCDAIGLGAFTATGASLALPYDNPVLVVALGVTTGIGGGVLRDVFVKEIPLVFRKEIYAVASAMGGVALYALQFFLTAGEALYAAFALVTAVRLLSVRYGVHLPRVRQ